jgi:predicted metal-dependent peptidase
MSTKTTTMTIAQRLSRARTQLLLNQPFFGTLSLRLKLEEGPIPTMATNGRRIIYNAEFVAKLKPAELEEVLAHEVMHCALGHQCRRGSRDPELWNRAADFAINTIVLANGLKLPTDALIDPAFANLSAEEIYARLARHFSSDDSQLYTQNAQHNAAYYQSSCPVKHVPRDGLSQSHAQKRQAYERN